MSSAPASRSNRESPIVHLGKPLQHRDGAQQTWTAMAEHAAPTQQPLVVVQTSPLGQLPASSVQVERHARPCDVFWTHASVAEHDGNTLPSPASAEL